MAKKSKVAPLPESEVKPAAMYMALSNLAMEDYIPRYNNHIPAAFSIANDNLIGDTGTSAKEELNYWIDQIEKNDEYTITEWNKVKGGLSW